MKITIKRAVEKAMNGPMIWGQDDCCLWVSDIVLKLTGVDVAEPLRGYSTKFGASRALKTFAGGGLVDAATKCARVAGLKRATSPYKNGDIAVCANEAGPVLAIMWDGHWHARTDYGVVFIPAWCSVISWRLPCHQQ